MITQHSRRGMLRGALGDVLFFPWGRGEHHRRLVAVAGMGRPGTFDRIGLRQLVRNLILALDALPNVATVCTVLIGSGEGTLTIAEAVRSLIAGIGEAVDAVAASDDLRFVAPVTLLRIVERERGRAEEIQREFASGGARAARNQGGGAARPQDRPAADAQDRTEGYRLG